MFKEKVWVLAILEMTRCLAKGNLKNYNDTPCNFSLFLPHPLSLEHLIHFASVFQIPCLFARLNVHSTWDGSWGEALTWAARSCPSPAACVPHPTARSQGCARHMAKTKGRGPQLLRGLAWASWEKGLEKLPTHAAFAFCYFSLSAFPFRNLWMKQPIWSKFPVDILWWIMFIIEQHRFSFFQNRNITGLKECLLNIRKCFQHAKSWGWSGRELFILQGQQKLSIHTHICATDKTYIMHIYM